MQHSDGSSPRVRGTGYFGLIALVGLRFIPACAGNSRAKKSAPFASPVHPRVCGEQGRDNVDRGIRKVHPRVCGEQAIGLDNFISDVGSSPRVRGTARERVSARACTRFIPACAGNSSMPDRQPPPGPVHPRVCGEQHPSKIQFSSFIGSSPRVRGTVHSHDPRQAAPRFIPACAGNSETFKWIINLQAVHPRVCGEQYAKGRRLCRRCGSSPRVRGTVVSGGPGLFNRRFIPACAGNRRNPLIDCIYCAVHPRVCGEQILHALGTRFGIGSSPRVRGTELLHIRNLSSARFIPACAGNSGSTP